jgi:hypothetical protein
LAGLSLHGTVAEFTLGRIEHYTVVALSASHTILSRSWCLVGN